MSKRESSPFGVAVVCAMVLLLAIGAFQIFRNRLVSGEFYPAWSSLRSEPDGTRLFFDSLAATGRVETVRKYKSLGQEPERNATVLYLGFVPGSLIRASQDDLDEFEKTARSGNRVVVALDPGHWLAPPKQESTGALAKRWGVGIGALRGNNDTTDKGRRGEWPHRCYRTRLRFRQHCSRFQFRHILQPEPRREPEFRAVDPFDRREYARSLRRIAPRSPGYGKRARPCSQISP
jgi:hypothetical protein